MMLAIGLYQEMVCRTSRISVKFKECSRRTLLTILYFQSPTLHTWGDPVGEIKMETGQGSGSIAVSETGVSQRVNG